MFKKAPGTHWRVNVDPRTHLAEFECEVGPCRELVIEAHLCKTHMLEWFGCLEQSGIHAGGTEGDALWDSFLDKNSQPWGPKPQWWTREAEAKRIMIEAVLAK